MRTTLRVSSAGTSKAAITVRSRESTLTDRRPNRSHEEVQMNQPTAGTAADRILRSATVIQVSPTLNRLPSGIVSMLRPDASFRPSFCSDDVMTTC